MILELRLQRQGGVRDLVSGHSVMRVVSKHTRRAKQGLQLGLVPPVLLSHSIESLVHSQRQSTQSRLDALFPICDMKRQRLGEVAPHIDTRLGDLIDGDILPRTGFMGQGDEPADPLVAVAEEID